MSDAQTATMRVNAPARTVMRNADDQLYYVVESQLDGNWKPSYGRGYPHSTSAYAQLGRITSRETKAAIKELRG